MLRLTVLLPIMMTSSLRWCGDIQYWPRPWQTLPLHVHVHSSNDEKTNMSDQHTWWNKTTTCQWRLQFNSPVWPSKGGLCDVWYKDLPYDRPTSLSQPFADSVSRQGFCIAGVAQECKAVAVVILHLSHRCDIRMYPSCAGVFTHGLPSQGCWAVLLVSL